MSTSKSTPTIDIWRRFRPTPSQEKFLRADDRGVLFSSGYGSGKSSTACRWLIDKLIEHAGSRGLLGRLTATDLRDTTMTTFWKQMGIIGFVGGTREQLAAKRVHYHHNKADREVHFWTGSVMLYRHLDDPDALGSLELNFAVIDEGAEVADGIYQTISSSRLRWHLPACEQDTLVTQAIERGASNEEIAAIPCHCPRYIRVLTNPGASGYLRAVTRGEVQDWKWIPAKPGDNPYNGPDYYAKMERDRKVNGEVWMKRFYEGSWDAFEGQRFPMFDRDRHVLDREWEPERHHRIVLGWDFGHVETFVAFIAYTVDGSEPVVVFDEVVVNEVQEPAQVADEVKDKLAKYGIARDRLIQMGDPAGDGASQFSAISPIGAYAGLGLFIAPAKKGKRPTDRADLLTAHLNAKKVMPDGTVWPGIVFSPRAPRAVDSIIGLRWKPQTGRLGEDPREVFLDVNKHGFDACLVPGTLVTTRRGSVPIEDVTTRDDVLTRRGWRQVERAWMTSPNAPVFKVELSNGASITGTANHLVLANGEWTRLDALSYGDKLRSCPSTSTSTAAGSTATQTLLTDRAASTSRRTWMRPRREWEGSTRRFGSRSTERFPMVTTSTTSTGTRSTTMSVTSSAWTPSHTPTFTSTTTAVSRCEIMLSGSVLSPRRGTHQKKDVPGTRSTPSVFGVIAARLRGSVSGAKPSMCRRLFTTVFVSAQPSAAPPSVARAESTTRIASASSVGSSSASTSTRRFDSAPVRVVSVRAAGTSPVYDLTVADQHEFFANGILVHNCTYGLYAVPPPDLPKPKPRYTQRLNISAQEAMRQAG